MVACLCIVFDLYNFTFWFNLYLYLCLCLRLFIFPQILPVFVLGLCIELNILDYNCFIPVCACPQIWTWNCLLLFLCTIYMYLCLFLCLYCKWIVKPGGASWWYSWPSVAHLAQPATLPSTDRWESRSVKTGERETKLAILGPGFGGERGGCRYIGRVVGGWREGWEGGRGCTVAWLPASPASRASFSSSLCAPVSQGTMPGPAQEGDEGVKKRWRDASDRARGGAGTWASLASQGWACPPNPACHTHPCPTLHKRWDHKGTILLARHGWGLNEAVNRGKVLNESKTELRWKYSRRHGNSVEVNLRKRTCNCRLKIGCKSKATTWECVQMCANENFWWGKWQLILLPWNDHIGETSLV